MREESQNSSIKVSQLVTWMYNNPGCKFYYSFTRQHAESLAQIIASNTSVSRETLVF